MKLNMTLLKNRFKDINAVDALELLCWTFGATHAFVSIDGTRVQLSELYDDVDVYTHKAVDIQLQFFGGPSPAKWWDGTLLMMLMDHILFAYANNDLKKVHAALKACFDEAI